MEKGDRGDYHGCFLYLWSLRALQRYLAFLFACPASSVGLAEKSSGR